MVENKTKHLIYYAVKIGRKPQIYTSWEECQAPVTGYSGAKFKKFKEEENAKKYMKQEKEEDNELELEEEMNKMKAERAVEIGKNGKVLRRNSKKGIPKRIKKSK